MKLSRNFFRYFFILISLVLFRKKVKTNPTLSEYEEITGFRYYGQPSKEGKIIDKKKLSGIIMPNRNGFINFSN